MEHQPAHRDCRRFAPVDVATEIRHGIRRKSTADPDACPEFQRNPQCRSCQSHTAEQGGVGIGRCAADAHTPGFPAYPDMVAVTGEMDQPN